MARIKEQRLPSAREVQAQNLKRVMLVAEAKQIKKPSEVFKLRHLSGLRFSGISVIPAQIPVSLTRGSLRDIDPWWHADPVQRHYGDEELTPDCKVGETDKYLVRTETRNIILLDDRKIKTMRKVFYDKKMRIHSKELLAEDESGRVFEYNSIPKNLMALDGLESVTINPEKDIVVVEGYPAAESLRKRGIDAVGIISGTFHAPSERALAPLLKARNILLWPDNDSAGAALMSRVAKALHKMGARDEQIKLVFWRGGPRKGDAYDFTGNDEELHNLLEKTISWSPELRFVANNIQYLNVPRTSANLRLDYRVRPPTPELLRGKAGSGADTVLEEFIRDLVDTESLSEEERTLLKSLVSRFSAKER